MEIKYCLRCKRNWCFRGTGRPTCCGKCKSPYWDKEKRDGDKTGSGNRSGGRIADAVLQDSPGVGRPAGDTL